MFCSWLFVGCLLAGRVLEQCVCYEQLITSARIYEQMSIVGVFPYETPTFAVHKRPNHIPFAHQLAMEPGIQITSYYKRSFCLNFVNCVLQLVKKVLLGLALCGACAFTMLSSPACRSKVRHASLRARACEEGASSLGAQHKTYACILFGFGIGHVVLG